MTTTQTKHTQGPWRATELGMHHGCELIYAPDNHLICDAGRIAKRTPEEMKANARLIASAPELLSALKDVSKAYQDMFDIMPVAFQTIIHTVDEAISKAEGKS